MTCLGRRLLLQSLILTWHAVFSLLQEPFLAFENSDGALALSKAPIIIAQEDFVGVHIASKNLATDLKATIGQLPEILNLSSANLGQKRSIPSAIILGTITASPVIKTLIDNGKIDVSDIVGKWESFKTFVVENPLEGIKSALVIAGSDKRGAIFGIYTISESAGQSPYYWWADVPARQNENLYALPISTRHGEPSVKYRGLFINDEAPALESWWSAKSQADKAPLNAEFYKRVFELLLRLKANFMWPAMWASWPKPGNIFFTDDSLNAQTADDYGIVVSTSHHEPMQRATNEWLFSGRGEWNWITNKKNITDFMREGVERAKDYETIYTIGMRGSADSRLVGGDPISIIRDVFVAQRDIFRDILGDERVAKQAWTIYKEVATYYGAGLTPPDDVTLVLPDDNWGNIQRLPTPDELSRPGGSGVYFHLEYVGVPIAYKWTNNNALPKVFKDISHVHQAGANEIWVINIGDIKPMELPFGFIMDYAWNTSSIDFHTIPEYLLQYATREFGSDFGARIGEILMDLNRLIALRKYEGVRENTFSFVNYNEADRILKAWTDLLDRSQIIYNQVPKAYQPAFFELVHYPCKSGYIFYNIMLNMGKNKLYGEERRNSANGLAAKVLELFDEDYDLTDEFDRLLGGKWANIMRQTRYDFNTSWVPPSRDTISGLSYVQLRQNTVPALGNLGVVAEGANSTLTGRWCEVCQNSKPMVDGLYRPVLPRTNPYATPSTIEIFMRGDYRVPLYWETETEYKWIHVEPSSGVVDKTKPDQRLSVTVDWDHVPPNFNDTAFIYVTSTQGDYEIVNLTVQNFAVPPSFRGYPEVGGLISIEGPHLSNCSKGDVAFTTVPYLGTRTNSGSLVLRPYLTARSSPALCKKAFAEYNFYLFSWTEKLEATLYFNMALDTNPHTPLEFSAMIDDAEPSFQRLIGQASSAGGLPPGWSTAVLDGVWTIQKVFLDVKAGEHVLRFASNSPEVYLEKIVLSIPGALRPSYLGPPETFRVEGENPSQGQKPHNRYGQIPLPADFWPF